MGSGWRDEGREGRKREREMEGTHWTCVWGNGHGEWDEREREGKGREGKEEEKEEGRKERRQTNKRTNAHSLTLNES